MFGYVRSDGQSLSTPPSHFKDTARSLIYQQLPLASTSSAATIRSAPTYQYKQVHSQPLHRSLSSSIFSKRSARSAPSLYSSSTATIPEDSEPVSTTIDQLVNDIHLHENYFKDQNLLKESQGLVPPNEEELYKISLGSELNYQNTPESLLDWNLNVTRCKLMLTQLPMVSSIPDFSYSPNSLPLLVGDLAQSCQIVLIQPHISDKELIYTLYASNIYQEHSLDANFKKSVAEISVKQSRLLQINSPNKPNQSVPIISADNQVVLKFKYKEIAIRNYLINLAAAATTAYEYKLKSDEIKKGLKLQDKKAKLLKEDKKKLWDHVRLDVFRRAGLEE